MVKAEWKRFVATHQTFPAAATASWSVLDKDKMETVPGTEGMSEVDAKARAASMNAHTTSRGTN